jgi:hypothetical protein
MFSSSTPAARRFFFAPATSWSMITVFHLACTIATRSPEPVVESVLAGASLQGLLFAFTIVGLGSAGAFDSSHFVKT